ncbi:hypothetical protein [Aquimarina mytili]|uniref:Uncharacterized protein n=1 Tax=Aquimarina mytili TaxID=874423 RepID=A0A937A2Z1_9FLAO|nr:hypothetical protein [Aquimarina mytili]MBL0683434.1 hypothetical protein [Aquimarina mytili]
MDLIDAIETFQRAVFSGELGASNLLGLNDYVDYIIGYAYGLASIIMVVLVGSKVIVYFVNPSGNMDPYILVKPILILIGLALYQPLVENLLVRPTNIIGDITTEAGMFVTSSGNINAFEDSYNSSITNIQDTSTNPDGSSGDGIYDILQVNPILEIIHLLIYFIASVVAGYVMLRQLIYKGIYFVLGVFALPLALIPGNQEVLKKWFFGFLSVLLWLPILTILKTILILIHNNTGSGFTQILLSVCLQVVMIIAVLRVPKYANILVSAGSDSGSRLTAGFITAPIREAYYQRAGRNYRR